MVFSWQWWVCQAFALVGLVFVIISFQQKNAKNLLWFRIIATSFCVVGLFFIWEISIIILNGVGLIRGATALYFAYKPKTNRSIRWIASCVIVALLISLNIIFWKNYYNIFSIVVGISLVVAFMQRDAKTIRKISIFSEILAITYCALLVLPISLAIEAFGLISAIIGIVRFDIKKRVMITEKVLQGNTQ